MNTNYVNVANTITNAPGTESFFNVTTGSDAYIEVLKDGWYRVGMIASFFGKNATSGGVGYARYTIDNNTVTDPEQQISVYHYGSSESRPNFSGIKYIPAGSKLRMEVAANASGVLRSYGNEVFMVEKIG